jgi:ubiquinone/menaquinone biosynthesis C-methylase UbiE
MEEDLKQGFDMLAKDYDEKYSFAQINILQRNHVLSYVKKNVLKRNKLHILEINCGTGEDAIYFEKLGNDVLATDASSAMINVAMNKMATLKCANITFKQLAFSEINYANLHAKYDLVFSNFGGLNVLNPIDLKNLFSEVAILLKPEGHFIGVIMPKYCFLEILYFFAKLKWRKMLRRSKKGPVSVNLGGTAVNTWFYSPAEIKKISNDFRLIRVKPIAIALPPAYLENYFKRKLRVLKLMNIIESIINRFQCLANCADHFLFDMQKV